MEKLIDLIELIGFKFDGMGITAVKKYSYFEVRSNDTYTYKLFVGDKKTIYYDAINFDDVNYGKIEGTNEFVYSALLDIFKDTIRDNKLKMIL